MQAVQIINPDQNGLYLVTAEELADLKRQKQQATDDMLLGARWGIKDIIKRLNGYSRDDLMKHILIPNKDYLMDIGAVLSWSTDSRGKYLFRATVMAKWLEDNLDIISQGGWT